MKQDNETSWSILSARTAVELKSDVESFDEAKELEDTEFADFKTMIKRVA